MENKTTTQDKDTEVIKKDPLKVVSRKPFVLESIEPSKDKQKELAVFTSSKKLAEYIYKVTQNAPVKFRWSIIGRMHDTCQNIIENLYLANFEHGERRLEYQKYASVQLRLLNHQAEIAYSLKIFPFKRVRIITEHVTYARKLLAGWAKSTMRKDNIGTGLLPPELAVDPPKKRIRRTNKSQQLTLNI